MRPCLFEDLTGVWDTTDVRLKTPVDLSDPKNAYFCKNQRYVFAKNGEAKHLVSEKPFRGEAERRASYAGPMTSKYLIPIPGSLAILANGIGLADNSSCDLALEDAPAGAQTINPVHAVPVTLKKGDIVLSQYDRSGTLMLAKYLRKSEEDSRAFLSDRVDSHGARKDTTG